MADISQQAGTRSSLGSTEIADTEVCETLNVNRYIHKLVTIKSDPNRLLGTLLHAGLRYWYGQFMAEPPSWFYERSMEDELNRLGQGYPKLIEQCMTVLHRYIAQFGAVDRAWTIIALEEEYTIGLDDPAFAHALEWLDQWYPGEARLLLATGWRPSVRADWMGSLRPMHQATMDYKSMVGWWGKLPNWHLNEGYREGGEYALGWQPHEYEWILRRVKNPDGSLRFPYLQEFYIQRIQKVDPYEMDRPTLNMSRSISQDVPKAIVRNLMHRRQLLDRVSRGYQPIKSPWACYRRSQCDYAPMCWDSDPQRVKNTLFKREE